MDIKVSIEGRVASMLAFAEPKRLARAVAVSIRDAGRDLRNELAAHTKAAGLGRLGTAWRVRFYRNRGLDAASLVHPRSRRAGLALGAFETGAIVRPTGGGRYLAIPTGANRKAGRRAGPPLVSPAAMAASGVTFTLAGSSGVKLWCIRALEAARLSRGVVRPVATAGGFHVVAKGKIRKTEDILKRGFVPMFVLVPQATIRKRIDIAGIVRPWPAKLARMIAENLDEDLR